MKKFVKYLVLVILVVSVLCTSVSAAVYSNAYISSVGGYIHIWGPGDISVEFNVTGTDIMDTIGAHRVTVFKMLSDTPDTGSDELVATYYYGTYPGLMITDEFYYSNSIRLQVEPGYQYYAVIIFYATLDGGGDNMLFSTKPRTA